MTSTMVPPERLMPPVLPTERLLANGKPVPALRTELRRIPVARNALALTSLAAQIIAVLVGAVLLAHPLAWCAAFVLMARAHTQLGVLSHEAAHRLLFPDQRINDFFGRWLLSYPTFISFDGYRRGHFSHHKDELGPNEPDALLYAGYPISRASARRKLRRDASGRSGAKILRGLLRGFWSKPTSRDRVARIFGVQLVLVSIFAASGRIELYLFLWLAPWLTLTRVVGRLRAVAEHGGMIRSKDRRATTHHVRQSLIANFFMVPYNTGWHLAHHLDMGVPWRNLPALHALMVEEGYVVPDLEYRSYRALWAAMIR